MEAVGSRYCPGDDVETDRSWDSEAAWIHYYTAVDHSYVDSLAAEVRMMVEVVAYNLQAVVDAVAAAAAAAAIVEPAAVGTFLVASREWVGWHIAE
jgi:hypothetical protein